MHDNSFLPYGHKLFQESSKGTLIAFSIVNTFKTLLIETLNTGMNMERGQY